MDAEVESPLREVSVADIGCLIERLQEHGVHGAKSRCLLLLLQSGVNTCPCRIYASQESGQPLVVITITRQWHGHHALGVFAREDAASLRCLAAALRAPGLQLWGTPFTADGVPLHVAHVLRTAAEERGLTWDGLAPFDLFVQESCQPPEHVLECPAGVVIRPLNEGHVDQVKRFWEYSDHVPGVDGIIRDGVLRGLSAGAFSHGASPPPSSTASASAVAPISSQTSPPVLPSALPSASHPASPSASSSASSSATSSLSSLDNERLMSWAVVDRNGGIGFLHTLATQRRRGLGRLVLAHLTQLCLQHGLPCVVCTRPVNTGVMRALAALRYERAYSAVWADVGGRG
ncbi:uncharacterized protein LOC119097802 [Pollicipes pollicipes]|uniref:uncharacterized protein LOC119097802 n=1 Tax=Pollicipes pollicipes TaxID=41117 RepID=UPI001884D9AC|nr:uncharacterized protein LOC119097802 [Pollicipes pollicipes]